MRLKTTSGAFQRKKLQNIIFNQFKGAHELKKKIKPNLEENPLSACTENLRTNIGPKNWLHERNNYE
jgi:hypothetical protein